jgi:hypothetical protein
MKKRGKHVSALVAAGCTLFAIGGVAPATAAAPKAKAKISVVTRALLLPPQGTNAGLGQTSAPCPSNRTLIGGGSRFDPSLGFPNIELVSSGSNGNSWDTLYDNNETTSSQVFSDAICLKNKLTVKGGDGGRVNPKVKEVTTSIVLPGQATNFGLLDVDVPCPKGYTVASGGLRVIGNTPGTGANEVTAFESGPNGNAWHARYDNDSTDPANAEASALCLKNKSKVKAGEDGKARAKLKQKTETVTLPPQSQNNGVGIFNVACPNGTKLVGGGARFGPGGTPNPDIELFESGPDGNAFHVRYNNNEATGQPALISAICLNQNLKVK